MSFIDPSVTIINGNQITVRQKDYVAPYATLNANKGVIVIGSSSTIQDNAKLIANPCHSSGKSGIFIGYNVVVGNGGPGDRGPAAIDAAIGLTGGAATSIGANALIDGAIIQPGAFVETLAEGRPGVTVPTGFRVLPGAQCDHQRRGVRSLAWAWSVDPERRLCVERQAKAGLPTRSPWPAATPRSTRATAPPAARPAPGRSPSAISAPGFRQIFFGALNMVLGTPSSEPGSKNVNFEPASSGTTPTFLAADGTQQPIAIQPRLPVPGAVHRRGLGRLPGLRGRSDGARQG